MGENRYTNETGKLNFIEKYRSWNIIVDIVTRLQDGRPRNCGSVRGRGSRFIYLARVPDPSTLVFVRYRKLVPVDKAAETYSYHGPTSNAETKNAWSSISTHTHLYALMAWCLIKVRDNTVFNFIGRRWTLDGTH